MVDIDAVIRKCVDDIWAEYDKDNSKLRKWATLKADAEKKKFKRPSEQCIKNLEQTSFNFAKIQGWLRHDRER